LHLPSNRLTFAIWAGLGVCIWPRHSLVITLYTNC
jgi:hypothetical protein